MPPAKTSCALRLAEPGDSGIPRAAVGTASCPGWVCDVDASGEVAASDASRILQRTVGVEVALTCPPC
jgi:hypothetical protein